MKVDLDWDERQRLTLLLEEYRADVDSGGICGYGQTKEEELAEVNALLAKVGNSE